MKIRTLTALALGGCVLGPVGLSHAGTMHFTDTAYTTDTSPFATSPEVTTEFWLEDFEDGLLNTLGLAATSGTVNSPGEKTDSVDGDGTGNMDGYGNDGYSFKHFESGGTTITFTFNEADLGQLPTYAGLVWTDGHWNAETTFEAFDKNGNSLGVIVADLGDEVVTGTTNEDRFLGISDDTGIAAITIHSSKGGLEVDHVQYGFAAGEVVPLPPAMFLGLAGVAGVAAWRRRKAKGQAQA